MYFKLRNRFDVRNSILKTNTVFYLFDKNRINSRLYLKNKRFEPREIY